MSQKEHILHDNWIEFLDDFATNNKGRKAYLESSKNGIILDMPLQAVFYDPVGKGNALTLSFGHQEIEVDHVIEAPTEIWSTHSSNGQKISLEITNNTKEKTLLIFKD